MCYPKLQYRKTDEDKEKNNIIGLRWIYLGVSAKGICAKHQLYMFPEETCNDLKHVTIILRHHFYSVYTL